jgi:hypothetical protein
MSRPLVLFFALLAAACPREAADCLEGETRCGEACADLWGDPAHCGACEARCGEGAHCSEAKCRCPPGARLCGASCRFTGEDSEACGECEAACGEAQRCQSGACVEACGPGFAECGRGCVALNASAAHCGACGRACLAGQLCRDGVCSYQAVASCFNSGQVLGLSFDGEAPLLGPRRSLGTDPAALAAPSRTRLLSVDGLAERLWSASISEGPFAAAPGTPRTGKAPNAVVAALPHVYVVNATSGTLQVLEDRADGLTTVAELPLGPNTFPEGLARLGDRGYLPLYGGFGASGAAGGQAIVEVDLARPEAPRELRRLSLERLDLESFDGGAAVARPFALVAHRGMLYAALNNLHPDSYTPAGPGLLARVDPVTGEVSKVPLGADCLNAGWVASDGARLFVSCQGRVSYSAPDFSAARVEAAGVVAVEDEGVTARWSVACGEESCRAVLPGRLAILGERLLVADQNGGRLFLLEYRAGRFHERRGFEGDLGPPLQACAVNPVTGVSNVSDVVAVP